MFVCACECVMAGCGHTLFPLPFVRLWENRLAACGFVLYPLSPCSTASLPGPPAGVPLPTWCGCGPDPVQPAPSGIDWVRFCCAKSRARVIVCCPLSCSDLLEHESRHQDEDDGIWISMKVNPSPSLSASCWLGRWLVLGEQDNVICRRAV